MAGDNNIYNKAKSLSRRSGASNWIIPTIVKVKKNGVWTNATSMKRKYGNLGWVTIPIRPLSANVNATPVVSYNSYAPSNTGTLFNGKRLAEGKGLAILRNQQNTDYVVVVGYRKYYNDADGFNENNNYTMVEGLNSDGTRAWFRYMDSSSVESNGMVEDMVASNSYTEVGILRDETSQNVLRLDYNGNTLSNCIMNTSYTNSETNSICTNGNGTYYTASEDGRIYAVNGSSATLVKTIMDPKLDNNSNLVDDTDYPIKSIMNNGNTILLKNDYVSGYSSTTKVFGGMAGTCGIYVNGKYYVGRSDGTIAVYNEGSFTTPILSMPYVNSSGSTVSAITYDGFGGLFVADNNGYMAKYNTSTGAKIKSWAIPQADPMYLSYAYRIAIANWSDIWVTTSYGTVYKFVQS